MTRRISHELATIRTHSTIIEAVYKTVGFRNCFLYYDRVVGHKRPQYSSAILVSALILLLQTLHSMLDGSLCIEYVSLLSEVLLIYTII